MIAAAFESQFTNSFMLSVAAGASDMTATAEPMPVVLVIGATILVALALRTATRAVASIVAQIAKAIVPAGMATLMLLAAFALVVFVAVSLI